MTECDRYNPDNVFQRFKLVEFPPSFVGLSTIQYLDVEMDLLRSAYLKTLCEGRLLKFEEARQFSESHRAFDIVQTDDSTIKVTFLPTSECVSRSKRKTQIDNRFVFDLRLIQVDEAKCCFNELHAEIGRFYISGQYEYCKVTHQPKVVDFGNAVINKKITKYIRMRNGSSLIAANVCYERLNGFDVVPKKFLLLPNYSVRLAISIKPTCLKVPTTLKFRITNSHYEVDDDPETASKDENYITYLITAKINIAYNKAPKEVVVESMHILYDPLPKYTYLNNELEIYNKRKATAMKHMNTRIKKACAKDMIKEKFTTGRVMCYSDLAPIPKVSGEDFCKVVEQRVTTYDLFDIQFFPFIIDFGRVGISTYGKEKLTITNKTKYNVTVRLLSDTCVLYTEDKLTTLLLNLKPREKSKLIIFCLGYIEGNYEGTFEYSIDSMYNLKHRYMLNVGKPRLMVIEKSLKLGMVTTESFITSAPIRIYNNYNNTTVHFRWDDISSDVPFEIIPITGAIKGQTCKMCDVNFICRPSKTKSHEVELFTEHIDSKIIPIELSVVTRKLSIKFLQPAVIFKDIALNIETVEKVKLENSSRELALFYVVEPLIPGLRMEPMSGSIRPKMIMTFDIIVKIPCVLEFSFDIFVKINNKENVILTVSGAVVEPKIIIQPKNVFMPRIPCHMMTFVPVTFQNLTSIKTDVEVLDTGDDNIFNVYIAYGNEKLQISQFSVEGGQTKTVFIKVCDIYRREYEMYIPFKINGLLGPPIEGAPNSTDLNYYIGEYEQLYDNNPKVKLKSVSKDICYCRIVGVITVPWLTFSVDKFEFDYKPNTSNTIDFSIKNISKYYLYINILTLKLAPNFTLELRTEETESVINDTYIKFELDRDKEAGFTAKFHPKYRGKCVATATLFLDKHMTIPYSNLTFIGKRDSPAMTPSTYRVIFPPCHVGTTLRQTLTIDFDGKSDLESFSFISKEEPFLSVKFIDYDVININYEMHTIITVQLEIACKASYTGNLLVYFKNESGSSCDVEVHYCSTYCPITLHACSFISPGENPYPYFPTSNQTELYNYMEQCCVFLEKWMFQQGFRRDLFPVIPDTFHSISSALSSQSGGKSGKGINVSYLNFIRRITGPLMKHVRKVSVHEVDESFKYVREIHDTYKGIFTLLQSRGANIWALQPRFLLSYEQFAVYVDNVASKCNADVVSTKQLLLDKELYKRLNKQSWIDFILQTYKVFIMDSCFFDCMCVSDQPRDIIKVIIDWYNEVILEQHTILKGKHKPVTLIKNITTDLSDGVAIISAIIKYCPFLTQHFSMFCEVHEDNKESDIVNNACLIIEAMNQLRLYFPLSSKDFFEPNFLQMLFLSIHLYIVLPMFTTKDTIVLNPPLLRSSSRHITISSSSQESLIFSYMLLNNNRNAFIVEKVPSTENGKKMLLSVKYSANFVESEECLLLVHGFNKTRIFDTYILFTLQGHISSLNPDRKCKVTGPLYRPNRVDILIASPFQTAATFRMSITDVEPTVPVKFDDSEKPRFYLRRLNLIDADIFLHGIPKEGGQDVQEHKLYLQIICLSTQVGNSWIWFRSDIGQFFIRVTTQPRWDLAIDTLQAKLQTWPIDPCSCGEACECYRTTVLKIPYRNELMLKALRSALVEHASDTMTNIFDQLSETTTGKIILGMLLEEGGTNMSDLRHILRSETTYKVTSRTLVPRVEFATLAQHTSGTISLPVTIPILEKHERYTITLTSECGMDIRTYKVVFSGANDTASVA